MQLTNKYNAVSWSKLWQFLLFRQNLLNFKNFNESEIS